jgi:hypothetical protein
MTISELIKKLAQYPGKTQVKHYGDDGLLEDTDVVEYCVEATDDRTCETWVVLS